MAAEKPRRHTSPFFNLPRLFTALSPSSDTDPVISPTSILDSKPFSTLKSSFWSETSTPRTPEPENRLLAIGSLGLVEVLKDEEEENGSKPSKMVLFGSQLSSGSLSPRSHSEFGIKTRNSQSMSQSPLKSTSTSPRPISVTDISVMESSEDYTCVISYGPNPKTVHIFGDCVVDESCFGDDYVFSSPLTPSDSFLSFCKTCKNNLGPGSDIYMYRGEMAFCSSECRSQEILPEERPGKIGPQ